MGQGRFPFYCVQLPDWDLTARRDASGESWALLREAQAKSVAAQPNMAMAVTIDVGESDNIHPRNQQPVGRQLALIAEARDYGKLVEWASPGFHSLTVEVGGKARVNFDHVGDGLSVHGDVLKGFAVAGEDLKFVPTEARVEGDSVVVSSTQVAAPTAMRYAWGNDPVGVQPV